MTQKRGGGRIVVRAGGRRRGIRGWRVANLVFDMIEILSNGRNMGLALERESSWSNRFGNR